MPSSALVAQLRQALGDAGEVAEQPLDGFAGRPIRGLFEQLGMHADVLRSNLHQATCTGVDSGCTASRSPIALRMADRLLSAGLPFGDNVR